MQVYVDTQRQFSPATFKQPRFLGEVCAERLNKSLGYDVAQPLQQNYVKCNNSDMLLDLN